MRFNMNQVYTAINADELKEDDRVIVADSIQGLQEKVFDAMSLSDTKTIAGIEGPEEAYRFNVGSGMNGWMLAYKLTKEDIAEFLPKHITNYVGSTVKHKDGNGAYLIIAQDFTDSEVTLGGYDHPISYDTLKANFTYDDDSDIDD